MKNSDLFEVLKFANLFVKSEKRVRNKTNCSKIVFQSFFLAARIASLLDEIVIFLKFFIFFYKLE